MKRGLIVLLTTCLSGLFAPNAAAIVDIRSSSASRLDFSVIVQQNSLSLQNAGMALDTEVLGFGFQAVDIPANLPIQIGLGGGYAFVDQQAISGLNNGSMGGVYLTLLARSRLFTAGRWDSEVKFEYEYLRVEKNAETQQSRLHWNHFTAEADLRYFFTHYLSIRLGALYGQLNAKLSGSVDNSIDEVNVNESLNTDSHVAGFVGLNYHLTDDQKLAIAVQRGYNNRIVIQFQRTFD